MRRVCLGLLYGTGICSVLSAPDFADSFFSLFYGQGTKEEAPLCFPDLSGVIPASTDQRFAISADGHTANDALMASQGAPLLASEQIPDLDSAIVTSTD